MYQTHFCQTNSTLVKKRKHILQISVRQIHGPVHKYDLNY